MQVIAQEAVWRSGQICPLYYRTFSALLLNLSLFGFLLCTGAVPWDDLEERDIGIKGMTHLPNVGSFSGLKYVSESCNGGLLLKGFRAAAHRLQRHLVGRGSLETPHPAKKGWSGRVGTCFQPVSDLRVGMRVTLLCQNTPSGL